GAGRSPRWAGISRGASALRRGRGGGGGAGVKQSTAAARAAPALRRLPQHVAGERRRDEGLTLEGSVNGQNELRRRRVLEHETSRAGVQGAARIGRLLVHGEEDDLDVGIVPPELDQRIDAVELPHPDV